MIDTIYIEEEVRRHPRALEVLRRFSSATVIGCNHYGEVFNPSSQSFRLQKRRPALIVARKHGKLVLDAPPGFGIGDERNYYFSHMLNCLYDCRYCFLQGMFRSAHYVLFVNFDDFRRAIDHTIEAAGHRGCSFFSGYDCDSLAMENLSGFAASFVPFFAARPSALLELRTKSVATRALKRLEPAANIVVAVSLTPTPAAAAVEHGAPSVAARIGAMKELAAAGWTLGIRLDPLLWYDGWEEGYDRLIDDLATSIPARSLHSVSIGPLRFPRMMFHRIEAMYPTEPLLAGPLQRRGTLASYGVERELELSEGVTHRLRKAFPSLDIFSCSSAAT